MHHHQGKVGKKDLCHETFYVNTVVKGYEFCKTAMKSYDLLVQASLIALEKTVGNKVDVSSDGDDEDWKIAREFYDGVFGGGSGKNAN